MDFYFRTKEVFKEGFFRVLYLPGHYFENIKFQVSNSSITKGLFRGGVQVYKEPMKFGGGYGMVSEIMILTI
jgi:hypothetical protein